MRWNTLTSLHSEQNDPTSAIGKQEVVAEDMHQAADMRPMVVVEDMNREVEAEDMDRMEAVGMLVLKSE